MNTSPNRPVRDRASALEVELTKGADGKLRSFRFSIGTAVVVVLMVWLTGGSQWLPALKWLVALAR